MYEVITRGYQINRPVRCCFGMRSNNNTNIIPLWLYQLNRLYFTTQVFISSHKNVSKHLKPIPIYRYDVQCQLSLKLENPKFLSLPLKKCIVMWYDKESDLTRPPVAITTSVLFHNPFPLCTTAHYCVAIENKLSRVN